MKHAAPCICLIGLTLWGQVPKPSPSVAPGGLVASRHDTLGKVIAGTAVETQRPAIPAEARALPVLTCAYSTGAGGLQEAHYWLGTPPPWHNAIPSAHPLNKLVQNPVQACPPAISQATVAARASVGPAAPSSPPVEEPPVRAAVPLPSFELTAADFKTQGLEYEDIFRGIYSGNFREVPFVRDSAVVRKH